MAHSTPAAVLLQALVYGAGHLVLPVPMLFPIGLLGLFLGVIAVWQKSLVQGMIVHAGVGLVALASSGPTETV